MNDSVPNGIGCFGSIAAVLKHGIDLGQTTDPDYQPSNGITDRLPFFGIEEDQRSGWTETVEEGLEECLLARAAENPGAGEWWLLILRQLIGQVLSNLLLIATIHPGEWNGERRIGWDLYRRGPEVSMCISRLVALERVLKHPRPRAFAHEPCGLVLTGGQVVLLKVSPVPPREYFLVHVVASLYLDIVVDRKTHLLTEILPSLFRILSLYTGNPRHIKRLKVQTSFHSSLETEKALLFQVLGHDISHSGRFLRRFLAISAEIAYNTNKAENMSVLVVFSRRPLC
jgi:hypothetical protein